MWSLLDEKEKQLVEFTIQKTLEQLGVKKPETINQSEAFERFGRGRIEKWERDCRRKGESLFSRKGLGLNSTKVVSTTTLEELDRGEKHVKVFFNKK